MVSALGSLTSPTSCCSCCRGGGACGAVGNTPRRAFDPEIPGALSNPGARASGFCWRASRPVLSTPGFWDPSCFLGVGASECSFLVHLRDLGIQGSSSHLSLEALLVLIPSN